MGLSQVVLPLHFAWNVKRSSKNSMIMIMMKENILSTRLVTGCLESESCRWVLSGGKFPNESLSEWMSWLKVETSNKLMAGHKQGLNQEVTLQIN